MSDSIRRVVEYDWCTFGVDIYAESYDNYSTRNLTVELWHCPKRQLITQAEKEVEVTVNGVTYEIKGPFFTGILKTNHGILLARCRYRVPKNEDTHVSVKFQANFTIDGTYYEQVLPENIGEFTISKEELREENLCVEKAISLVMTPYSRYISYELQKVANVFNKLKNPIDRQYFVEHLYGIRNAAMMTKILDACVAHL